MGICRKRSEVIDVVGREGALLEDPPKGVALPWAQAFLPGALRFFAPSDQICVGEGGQSLPAAASRCKQLLGN